MPFRSALRKLFHNIAGSLAVVHALYSYWRNNPIPSKAWHFLLRAHCHTNGRFTDALNPLLQHLNPPSRPSAVTGLLGHFTIEDQNGIVECLGKNGYYIFDNLIPKDICDEIEAFARNEPCHAARESGLDGSASIYASSSISAHLYKFSEMSAAQNPAIQRLMADQALLQIAEAYLQTTTIVGGIDTWWSVPFGNRPSSEAAQMFHFDFDSPPLWLKLFVYVTPVTADRGPHVYVKGSHKAGIKAAQKILSRGYSRISDEDIEKAFGQERVVEITGPRGTAFLADTRGFHKGKYPTAGDRLITQLIYCSPVFNNHAPPLTMKIPCSAVLDAAAKTKPKAYVRYI